MRTCSFLVLLCTHSLLLAVAPQAAHKESDNEKRARQELKAVQGEWRLVPGKDIPPGLACEVAKRARVIVRDDLLIVRSDDMEIGRMRIKLHPEKKPKEIDAVYEDEKHKGVVDKGIYELKGNSLRICWGDPRPTDFETKEGDRRRLMVLTRKQK